MGLFYSKAMEPQLLGYVDVGYLSDPHKAQSQTGYIFTYGNTAKSWSSVKRTMVATSSNHSMHEASRECVWLRSMIQHIRESCGLSSIKNNQQYYMKTMLHVLRKSKEDILKVIELSTFRQSSSTLMNFKKMVKLMCNK